MPSTKQKIMTMTIQQIREVGYQQFSMRKLAKALGLSATAIYKHFEGKDALFKQATIELSAQFVQGLSLNRNRSPEDQLLQIAQQLCDQFQLEPNLMSFLFFNPQAINIMRHPVQDFSFLNLVRQIVHEANHGNCSDEHLLIKLWSFIQGYTSLIINHIIEYDPVLVAAALTELN
ncbi:TetR/AcrR family transcriptional regulator [Limosilactobacillus caecicola]|uniref:TetR/AcrR family transcriptional regulator n=1 Tax=Limosilactobacillus caecicola TaxID=2941332 RepID=UPI00203CC5B8|nr:TetR/AcrR family transcriptional regulator [Limosilactobacillus caecicola]